MNNFFDIKRFGKYLSFDLRRCRNEYGISLLVLGLSPVLVFILVNLFNLVIHGNFDVSQHLSIPVMGIAVLAAILSFPQKVYGRVTEKKYGSSFLMIPASAFEKWLSMVIVVCVVLPVLLAALLLASDALLSLVFPSYGSSAIVKLAEASGKFSESTKDVFEISLGWSLFSNWCQNALLFTLGAIFFKTSKIAKTILVCAGLCIVALSAAVLVFGSININSEQLQEILASADGEHFIFVLKTFVVAANVVIFSVLLSGLYFRIKTIKL